MIKAYLFPLPTFGQHLFCSNSTIWSGFVGTVPSLFHCVNWGGSKLGAGMTCIPSLPCPTLDTSCQQELCLGLLASALASDLFMWPRPPPNMAGVCETGNMAGYHFGTLEPIIMSKWSFWIGSWSMGARSSRQYAAGNIIETFYHRNFHRRD